MAGRRKAARKGHLSSFRSASIEWLEIEGLPRKHGQDVSLAVLARWIRKRFGNLETQGVGMVVGALVGETAVETKKISAGIKQVSRNLNSGAILAGFALGEKRRVRIVITERHEVGAIGGEEPDFNDRIANATPHYIFEFEIEALRRVHGVTPEQFATVNAQRSNLDGMGRFGRGVPLSGFGEIVAEVGSNAFFGRAIE